MKEMCGDRGAVALPPTFSEIATCQWYLLEICFCFIFQGIQKFFGPSTPRILSGALVVKRRTSKNYGK